MENIKDPSSYRTPVLLQSEELIKYILETAIYPREPKPLKELRDATQNHPSYSFRSFIATSPDAGQLITILLKLLNPKKTIEVGVFTGYSLLLTALNIPDDGKITAIDIDRKAYEVGLPVIKKAAVEHKIDFIESPALPILDKLLEDPANEGTYEFAYIDADKENYVNYHERLIKLVKVGGLLVYDNVLWGGRVAWPEEEVPLHARSATQAIIEFNKRITQDSRVEFAFTSVGDGLSICRRIA
ncbi:probable caffeoyl-CoA O-methyltransferase At4g26220 [Gastrolobium bilobum]|uniref:probable caffeoyl-CoA O-methyltransferase At4g26220 n=1 Tax=Gastrolobium bilobum TaxID=150636 RepID=UPI002AB0C4D8|nr:probable caffeoyl-CoA O-methyltransferase At4g26220 [Gastrolobium bilobum]XP_061352653.1 probable caffeoyl-CoA O-methyltransferase At4g26220 [Gastrolobium bilobum]XP_061352654.1 probable caffeoyl-CoA O-methyltransferase At4g26220 [Gastrolobium bilobum]